MAVPQLKEKSPQPEAEKAVAKIELSLNDLERQAGSMGKKAEILLVDTFALRDEWEKLKAELEGSTDTQEIESAFDGFEKKIGDFKKKVEFAGQLSRVEDLVAKAWKVAGKDYRDRMLAVESDLRAVESDFLNTGSDSKVARRRVLAIVKEVTNIGQERTIPKGSGKRDENLEVDMEVTQDGIPVPQGKRDENLEVDMEIEGQQEDAPKRALPPHEQARELPSGPERRALPPHEGGVEKPRSKFKVSFVDVSSIVDSRARDAGNRAITERAQATGGTKLQKVGRFFKGLGSGIVRAFTKEGRRQNARIAAKRDMLASGNVLASESGTADDSRAEMSAIVDRFSSEFADADVISTARGEKRESVEDSPEMQQIKGDINQLILRYADAGADFTDPSTLASFNQEKNIILDRLKAIDKAKADADKLLDQGELFADNLVDIVRQVQLYKEHQGSLEGINLDIDLTLGRARDSVRTEANMGAGLDKAIDALQKNKVTRYLVNEGTIAVAGILGSLALRGGVGVARKILSWGSFGLGTVLSGAYAAGREGRRLKLDREQHAREMARGENEFEAGSKRREEQETYRHETMKAEDVIEMFDSLDSNIEAEGYMNAERMAEYLNILAHIEATVELANARSIDLISYSEASSVEQQNTEILIKKAQLKVKLRQLAADNPSWGINFDSNLSFAKNLSTTERTGEVDAKDKAFNKMKRSKALKKALATVMIGGAIGLAFQEGSALLSDKQTGLFEGRAPGEKSETLLRYLRGDSPEPRPAGMMDMSSGHSREAFFFGTNNTFKFPDGVELRPQLDSHGMPVPNGELTLFRGEQALVSGIKIDSTTGIPDMHSQMALQNAGVKIDIQDHLVTTQVDGTQTTEQFMKDHPGEFRSLRHFTPYGYGTENAEAVERNELRMHFGGARGTGIRPDGKFEFSVRHMFGHDSATGRPIELVRNDGTRLPDSFTRSVENMVGQAGDGHLDTGRIVDPKDLAVAGKLKLVIVLDRAQDSDWNAGKVIEIPFDANGKVVIDPTSTAGKAFADNGGQLDIKAFRVGVVHDMGTAKDGSMLGRFLSRTGGEGMDSIGGKVEETTKHFTTTLEVPKPDVAAADIPYDVPPIIPIPYEKAGLEKQKQKEKGKKKGKTPPETPPAGGSEPTPPETPPETPPAGGSEDKDTVIPEDSFESGNKLKDKLTAKLDGMTREQKSKLIMENAHSGDATKNPTQERYQKGLNMIGIDNQFDRSWFQGLDKKDKERAVRSLMRKLSREFHPDLNPDRQDNGEMQAITTAQKDVNTYISKHDNDPQPSRSKRAGKNASASETV